MRSFITKKLCSMWWHRGCVLSLTQRHQLRDLLHHCIPVPQAGTRPLREARSTVLGAQESS
jgi:hypothetical protein